MSEQSTVAHVPEQVEYRDVPGHPGYRVGADGRVWTSWRLVCLGTAKGGRSLGARSVIGTQWRRMKLGSQKSGHLHVRLFAHHPRRNRRFRVHCLVMLAFVGPCPPGKQVRHLDGDPTNNRLGNLAYGTPRENCEDTVRHGRSTRGERHAMAKLTSELVLRIRREAAAGRYYHEIAADLGVSKSNVHRIVTRLNWAWLPDETRELDRLDAPAAAESEAEG